RRTRRVSYEKAPAAVSGYTDDVSTLDTRRLQQIPNGGKSFADNLSRHRRSTDAGDQCDHGQTERAKTPDPPGDAATTPVGRRPGDPRRKSSPDRLAEWWRSTLADWLCAGGGSPILRRGQQ